MYFCCHWLEFDDQNMKWKLRALPFSASITYQSTGNISCCFRIHVSLHILHLATSNEQLDAWCMALKSLLKCRPNFSYYMTKSKFEKISILVRFFSQVVQVCSIQFFHFANNSLDDEEIQSDLIFYIYQMKTVYDLSKGLP